MPEQLPGDPALITGVPDHFEANFGPPEIVYHEHLSEGVHVDVYQFGPADENDFRTFVTSGMAALPMAVPGDVKHHEDVRFAELVLHLPLDWPTDWATLQQPTNIWPLHLIRQLARYPHTDST